MATPNAGLLKPIAALLRWRGMRAADPATLDEVHGILDAVPAAIVVQSPDGRVLIWNRAAARLFGWADLKPGESLPPFVPPDARAEQAALRRRVLAGNEVFRARGHFLHASGEVLDLLVNAAPRRGAARKIVGIVSMLEEPPGGGNAAADLPPPMPKTASQDASGGGTATVSEGPPDEHAVSVHAPETQKQGNERQASARIFDQPSRLLAQVSHDLRQPLHALGLLTGALERRVKEPAVRDLVNDAGAMVRALQATFDNLVDLGRLDQEQVQAHPADVIAGDVLAPLATEFAREAAGRNIAFRHVGSSAVISTDPLLVQRLLRQLLQNALRFAARADGAHGKVLLGARRHGDRLRLVVADGGIGIPADQQASIFEPFVQSDAGRAAGGLGLGLAIAARLAALLDVKIRLQSQPGRGCRFWIDVPLKTAARGHAFKALR